MVQGACTLSPDASIHTRPTSLKLPASTSGQPAVQPSGSRKLLKPAMLLTYRLKPHTKLKRKSSNQPNLRVLMLTVCFRVSQQYRQQLGATCS